MRAAVRGSVDEVIAVARLEEIEADIVRSGVLHVARSQAQADRLGREAPGSPGGRAGPRGRSGVRALRPRLRPRPPGEAGGRRGPRRAGARRTHPRGHPRRAHRARRRGDRPGHRPCARSAALPRGIHRRAHRPPSRVAPHELRDRRGRLPPTEAQWTEIGWSGEELLGDEAHAYCYAQRTADGRIAMGGRGVPYRFGSRTDVDGRTQDATIESLRSTLTTLFPSLDGVALDHAWCGVLGVPRDWSASVSFDPATGLGHAGGYVGSGLTATNLAGRTLRDLVLGHDTDLARLPWTNHRVRRWEPGAAALGRRARALPALPGRRPARGRRARAHQPHRPRRPPRGRALTRGLDPLSRRFPRSWRTGTLDPHGGHSRRASRRTLVTAQRRRRAGSLRGRAQHGCAGTGLRLRPGRVVGMVDERTAPRFGNCQGRARGAAARRSAGGVDGGRRQCVRPGGGRARHPGAGGVRHVGRARGRSARRRAAGVADL